MNTKQNILALLESNRGHSISGEYIAERLNVSRNAVWKAVKSLEKSGYKIKASTNKGYCLCEDNDILSVQGMLPYLTTAEAGGISLYESLESTNKTAKELAVSGAAHGTVIVADHQTKGKGRYGRSFHSPPGHGIYMSFILYPARLRLSSPTLITALAAVSVCEAIDAVCGKYARIKWVNDIFLDGKKICGILTEAVTDFESGGIQWAVAGIGINFSTPATAFPEDLREVAGAVFSDGRPTATRNQLAAEIINRMTDSERYTDKEMLKKYRQRLLMLGKEILVTEGTGTSYEAVALDIDDTGRLIVKRAAGEVVPLAAGEISVREKLLR